MEAGEAVTVGLLIIATATDIEARARLIHPLLAFARALPDQDTEDAETRLLANPSPVLDHRNAAGALLTQEVVPRSLDEEDVGQRSLSNNDCTSESSSPLHAASADTSSLSVGHVPGARALALPGQNRSTGASPLLLSGRHSRPSGEGTGSTIPPSPSRSLPSPQQPEESDQSLPSASNLGPRLDILHDYKAGEPSISEPTTPQDSASADSHVRQGVALDACAGMRPRDPELEADEQASAALPRSESRAPQGATPLGLDKKRAIKRLEAARRGLEALQLVPQPWRARLAHLASYPCSLGECLIMAQQFRALSRIRDKPVSLFPDALLLFYARYGLLWTCISGIRLCFGNLPLLSVCVFHCLPVVVSVHLVFMCLWGLEERGGGGREGWRGDHGAHQMCVRACVPFPLSSHSLIPSLSSQDIHAYKLSGDSGSLLWNDKALSFCLVA
jgi:hypothetical protein